MSRVWREVSRWFDRLETRLEAGLVDAGEDWHTYNLLNVATWRKKPQWNFRVEREGRNILLISEATGRHKMLWVYVDKGTGLDGPRRQRYPIRPRDPNGSLVFRENHDPKTRAVAQANVGTGESSGALLVRKLVMHPGITKRDFTGHYARENRREIISKILRQARRT